MPFTKLTLIAGAAALAALPLGACGADKDTKADQNGRLVLQRPAGDLMDLYSIQADGKGARRLTNGQGIEEQAAWSADGRRIAFVHSPPGGSPTEIWTMNPDGGNRRQVTRFGSLSSAPSWSPDGAVTFYSTKDYPPPSKANPTPPDDVYSIAADGTRLKRLTKDDQIQFDPDWSPDGRRITYMQMRAVPGEPGVFDQALFVMNEDGSGVKTLMDFSPLRDVNQPTWSPDGKWIVFEVASASPRGRTGGEGRQSDIAVIRPDGTGYRRLTRSSALETHPVWSPDGKLIAFTGDRQVHSGKQERLGPDFELYTMRADGTGIRRLTHNHVPDLYPDWQPVSG